MGPLKSVSKWVKLRMSEPSSEKTDKEPKGASNPVQGQEPIYMADGVIDVRFLFAEILRKWWIVLICSGFGIWSGVIDMHNFSPSYKAVMLVSPVEDNVLPAGGGTSASVVGALTGINLSVDKRLTKLDRLVHKVSTIKLAKILDNKHGLMEKVFGGKWDGNKRIWERPKGTRFEYREKINSFLNLPLWSEPSIEDLSSFLSGSFKSEDVDGTPYKKFSFSHGDPEQALHFLNLIFEGAEKEIRIEDELESSRRREYLEGRLQSTEVIEFKDALVSLLAEEERREIMAQGGFQRIVKILDVAYVSKHKTSPAPVRFIGVPFVLYLSLAIGFILILVLVRKE